ncbi:MAG: Bug family tripartite tricarboxylate transporter substrate binding protein [Lautropia sp.]
MSESLRAQSYPAQPVSIIVPYPAGGYFDRVARVVAERLALVLKQPFVVENKVGASGMLGTEFVARAKPDGYTLLLGGQAQNVISVLTQPKVARYDSLRDFASIVLLADAPNVLVVPAGSSVRTFADLVEFTRRNQASYASNGVGVGTHLMMELLKAQFGLDITHVPFKGSVPAITAVAGGHVTTAFATISDILPHIRSGRVRALAVTGMQPLAALPGVPTMEQAVGKGFESSTWSSLHAPAGTPDAILKRLNAEINSALADPVIAKKISPEGEIAILGGTQDDLTTMMKSEFTKWGKLIDRLTKEGSSDFQGS